MKYFAYGSNMLTERLQDRVSSAKNPRPLALRGHRLRFHKKSSDCSGKCNIVETACDGDVVHGALYEVEDAQMSALDAFEGVGHGYRRDEITVSLDGTTMTASVYVAEKTRSTTLSCLIAGITIWSLPEPNNRDSRAITLQGYAPFHLPRTPSRIERPD